MVGVGLSLAACQGRPLSSDRQPPLAAISYPTSDTVLAENPVVVTGVASDESTIACVRVNHVEAKNKGINFSIWEAKVDLAPGTNWIKVYTEDEHGNIDPNAAFVTCCLPATCTRYNTCENYETCDPCVPKPQEICNQRDDDCDTATPEEGQKVNCSSGEVCHDGSCLTGNAAPAVTVIEPKDGRMVQGEIQVAVTAEDPEGSVSQIVVELPGGAEKIVSGATALINWDTATVADGPYQIIAYAIDDQGNQSPKATASIQVCNQCENQPPEIEIIDPQWGGMVKGMVPIRVSVNDPDGRIFYIKYMLEGPDRFVYSNQPPYEIEWDSTLVEDGEAAIWAIAYDDFEAYQHDMISVVVANHGG